MTTLTPADVADIVAILDGTPYGQIDIATARFRLRIARDTDGGGADRAGWSQEWDYGNAGAIAPAGDAAGFAAGVAPAPVGAAVPDGLSAVPAPLPGVFYHAPAPGAAPFVAIGDPVAADTVVGIVETMKLMNPVHAGCAGTVEAFCIANATMVDAGTALLHIRNP